MRVMTQVVRVTARPSFRIVCMCVIVCVCVCGGGVMSAVAVLFFGSWLCGMRDSTSLFSNADCVCVCLCVCLCVCVCV